MSRPTDRGGAFEDVLTRAVAGDGDAFEDLYHRLQRRVSAYVSVRGCGEVDEVVNDVFFQVFSNLGRFSGTEPQFNAWVFRITRNLLVDHARRDQRRPVVVDLDTGFDVWVTDADLVERQALSAAGTGTTLDLLRYLTDDQAEVLLLRTVADLTVAQVASVTGKPVGAVKATQRRALRTLSQRIISSPAVPLTSPRNVTRH